MNQSNEKKYVTIVIVGLRIQSGILTSRLCLNYYLLGTDLRIWKCILNICSCQLLMFRLFTQDKAQNILSAILSYNVIQIQNLRIIAKSVWLEEAHE